jgi:DNA topoisomerase VI subunit B
VALATKAQPPVLTRHVFKTSRLAEFCSARELTNQTGHAVEDWPLVVLKELVDNALDAAEEAGVAPVIEIAVSKDGIQTIGSWRHRQGSPCGQICSPRRRA